MRAFSLLSVVTVFLASVFLSACAIPGAKLTDALMESYLTAYSEMKAEGLAVGNGPVKEGADRGARFDGIVKKAGFSGMPQFMAVQAEIGKAMSLVESDSYMKEMDSMSGIDDPRWAEFKKMIADPNVPEESKNQIRESFAKAKADYVKNKKMAMPILNIVKGATSGDSLEIAKKYHSRLRKLYTGMDQ